MKLSTSTFWQAVAWIAALGSQSAVLAGVLPMEWMQSVTAAAAIAGILLHLHAGNRDQQGNVIPKPQ